MLASVKLRERLAEQLRKEDYFNERVEKYAHIYDFDFKLGYVTKEIKEILASKVGFWREICKEKPKALEIETVGEQLVEKIEALHLFYMEEMRPCELTLSNFSCSLIYASYLLSTTNYSNFATTLLKRN